MNQRIQLASVDDQINATAREAVRQRISWPVNLTPANVTYHSRGHALLVGNAHEVSQAALALQGRGLASLTLLTTDTALDLSAASEPLICQTLTHTQQTQLRITGYLGAFQVDVVLDDNGTLNLAQALIERDAFDVVLDLTPASVLSNSSSWEIPPPGYVRLNWMAQEAQRGEILESIVELVGEFDKPRYFQVNSDICAHSASGNVGCTRCLDVCPADAISSVQGRIESRIEIDPFLCQGVGSCTSACPTGAIEFRLPETRRQQDTLATWLAAYREAGGQVPVMRFITHDCLDAERNADVVTPGHLLDVPLEELGAAGHDQWLTALANGAAEVRIQLHDDMPPRLTAFIAHQIAQAHVLLEALGHDTSRVKLLKPEQVEERDALPNLMPLIGTALTFTEPYKRARFNQVLATLAALGAPSNDRHVMPKGSAYGGIQVDREACTLCHACVSNCPTPALKSGGDTPALSFLEADCVQCGLCEQACPEDAITLLPGFLAASDRDTRHICHEEAAFECIGCGKPFATASTIATIKAKLADHPYFAGDALARLEMCEDCRVKDVWKTMIRDPDAQLKV
ncbi:4Fe-4S dicluster domain-containing protein [Vreelandella andesensis]|uniref:4Fe-4S dicluster domain-containing protein n=1 Tax=Vreelandella andesensis TaxID=447567 RepID=A0A433KQK6_9GAMM|nr:4Fe-4S binding protein [Halomonas andesensis]RUR31929.1 4Fe-4S dicluster domain-containing protein [Halomonas andesensis]